MENAVRVDSKSKRRTNKRMIWRSRKGGWKWQNESRRDGVTKVIKNIPKRVSFLIWNNFRELYTHFYNLYERPLIRWIKKKLSRYSFAKRHVNIQPATGIQLQDRCTLYNRRQWSINTPASLIILHYWVHHMFITLMFSTLYFLKSFLHGCVA